MVPLRSSHQEAPQNKEYNIPGEDIQAIVESVSRLVRNVLLFNSLEMSPGDLIQVMPGWCAELECYIFSRDDSQEECISFSVQGSVGFDEGLKTSGVTH